MDLTARRCLATPGANFVSGSEGRPSDPEDESMGLGGGELAEGLRDWQRDQRKETQQDDGHGPLRPRSLSGQRDGTRKTVNRVKETRHSRCG